MGALMGGGVGLTIGFIFGSWSIIRYVNAMILKDPSSPPFSGRGGAGPRGFMATLSQYMLSSAATFSFFLAIGSVGISLLTGRCRLNAHIQVIRSDSMVSPHLQAAHTQLFSSSGYSVQSRAGGAQLIKARWEAERMRLASSKE